MTKKDILEINLNKFAISRIALIVLGTICLLLINVVQAAVKKPLRIMTLGNSITAGFTDNPKWDRMEKVGMRPQKCSKEPYLGLNGSKPCSPEEKPSERTSLVILNPVPIEQLCRGLPTGNMSLSDLKPHSRTRSRPSKPSLQHWTKKANGEHLAFISNRMIWQRRIPQKEVNL